MDSSNIGGGSYALPSFSIGIFLPLLTQTCSYSPHNVIKNNLKSVIFNSIKFIAVDYVVFEILMLQKSQLSSIGRVRWDILTHSSPPYRQCWIYYDTILVLLLNLVFATYDIFYFIIGFYCVFGIKNMIYQRFCWLLRDISQFGPILGYTSRYFLRQNFKNT